MSTEPTKNKIIICDDLQNIVDYFSMIIQQDPSLVLIGTARSAGEAVALAEAESPTLC